MPERKTEPGLPRRACPGPCLRGDPSRPRPPVPRRRYGPWLGFLILTGGCAPSEPQEVVARVNGTPIVAQELELARERKALAGDDGPEVRQRLIQSIVVDELLAQQYRRTSPGSAQVDKFVAKAIQRELLARHFAAMLAAKVPPPAREEIRAYYRSQPGLYAQRQVFELRRLEVPASGPDTEKELHARLTKAASLDEVVEWLRKAELRFVVSKTELAANEVPEELAESLHRMRAGQVVVLPADQGLQIIQLLNARNAPLGEAEAWPLIEQRLRLERQRAALEAEIQKLSRIGAIRIGKGEPQTAALALQPLSSLAPRSSISAPTQGGWPAALPSCPAQPAQTRRAGHNPVAEGLMP